MGDVAHVALDEGIDVLARPGGAAPTRWPGHGLGVAAAQHALDQRLAHGGRAGLEDAASEGLVDPVGLAQGHFALRQGQQRQGFHPPRQGIGHGGQCHQVGRPGEQEAARAAIFIHAFLDGQQQLRRALDFVDHGANEAAHHPDRVFPRRQQGQAIVQGQIAQALLLRNMPYQRGFAGLARACKQDDGGVEHGLGNAWCDEAGK